MRTTYTCEKCGDSFPTEGEAEACETAHPPAGRFDVVEVRYDGTGATHPNFIEVVTRRENGEEIWVSTYKWVGNGGFTKNDVKP